MARWRRRIIVVSGAAMLASACTLLTDLSDFAGGPSAEQEAGTDATGDDTNAPDAPDAADAGVNACADADIASNAEHCGSCFHSCFGGACTFGQCQPVAVVTGLPRPVGLAVAGGKLYVGTPGAIRQYLLDGGARLDVAVSPDPRYIAASATHLYWCDRFDSAVKRWPLAGGQVDVLATNVASAQGVALSADHIYFTHYTLDGGVERVLLDGGGREVVFDLYSRPEDVDFAKGELIVGGDGVNELAVFADAGFGTKRVLATGTSPVTMTVDGDDIFYVEQGAGNIKKVPFAGGANQLVATGARLPTGVATTKDSVFWLNNDGGTVMRLAR